MSLAFIFGTNLLDYDPRGLHELHAAQPVVQDVYDQVGAWTGLDVDTLLRRSAETDGADPIDVETRSRRGSVGLATAMIAIHDLLGSEGVHPAAVGGLSLGAMVSSCLAGVLSRRDLFDMLMTIDSVGYQDPDRVEGVAVAFVPSDVDPATYVEPHRAGVHLGGDFGTHPSGQFRILLLTGYREALDTLAAETTVGSVQVQGAHSVAVHSPLRASVRDSVSQYLAGIRLDDPKLPLCSSLDRRTVTSADEVRDMFARNATDTIHIDHLTEGLHAHGVRLGLILGPSLPKGWIGFPFPVVHLERPEDLGEVMSAIFDFGVTLPQRVTL